MFVHDTWHFVTSQFQNDILRRYNDSEEDEEDYDYEDGNLSLFSDLDENYKLFADNLD